jgi:hypothetical protein
MDKLLSAEIDQGVVSVTTACFKDCVKNFDNQQLTNSEFKCFKKCYRGALNDSLKIKEAVKKMQ